MWYHFNYRTITVPFYGNYTQPRSCPVGHYCPPGTKFADQYPCPVGTFGDSVQMQDVTECTDCLPGTYTGFIRRVMYLLK